jgi:glycosyltransferase involved in cell wall biosynthesis
MKISIITICFNAGAYLEEALNSFFSQDYNNKELVIIDGGSTDKTLDILNRYKSQFGYFVSEKDNGLYDALNKGIKNSTGDIIGILHADDLLAYPQVLSDVANQLIITGADSLYADLNYVKQDGKTIHRNWISGNYEKGKFAKGWMPPHPTFFAKKELFEKYGLYNTSFKQAADYELMLRFLHKHLVSVTYLAKVISLMRVGGKSNVSIKNRLNANKEDYLAWKINNLKPPFGFRLIKPLSKLEQFFRS